MKERMSRMWGRVKEFFSVNWTLIKFCLVAVPVAVVGFVTAYCVYIMATTTAYIVLGIALAISWLLVLVFIGPKLLTAMVREEMARIHIQRMQAEVQATV